MDLLIGLRRAGVDGDTELLHTPFAEMIGQLLCQHTGIGGDDAPHPERADQLEHLPRPGVHEGLPAARQPDLLGLHLRQLPEESFQAVEGHVPGGDLSREAPAVVPAHDASVVASSGGFQKHSPRSALRLGQIERARPAELNPSQQRRRHCPHQPSRRSLRRLRETRRDAHGRSPLRRAHMAMLAARSDARIPFGIRLSIFLGLPALLRSPRPTTDPAPCHRRQRAPLPRSPQL